MCIRHFATIAVVSCLLALCAGGGCNPEQLNQVDQVMADANDIGQGITEFVEGPAGTAIPPKVRMILELLGFAGGAALLIWQQIRGQVTKVTAASIVKAVEALPETTQSQVKSQVKSEMIQQGIYSQGNAVVDKLKAS